MEKNEHLLVQQLQDRQQSVVSELYDRYAPALYGIVLKIVRSEVIAEDVLQEAFIKIWNNGANYDPRKGSLFTWMLNIARNTAIDKTRSAGFRNRKRVGNLEPFTDMRVLKDHQPNPDTIGLRKVVDTLEEKYRIIIDLIYFQGFTQREVQEYLDLPLGTVKSRTRIALGKLRRIFLDHRVTILLLWSVLLLT